MEKKVPLALGERTGGRACLHRVPAHGACRSCLGGTGVSKPAVSSHCALPWPIEHAVGPRYGALLCLVGSRSHTRVVVVGPVTAGG